MSSLSKPKTVGEVLDQWNKGLLSAGRTISLLTDQIKGLHVKNARLNKMWKIGCDQFPSLREEVEMQMQMDIEEIPNADTE